MEEKDIIQSTNYGRDFMKSLFFTWLTLCCSCFVHASTTQKVFEKYPNHYFVETGTWYGDGVQMALNTGFQEVYSIELAPHYYEKAQKRFLDQKNVHLYHGDSAKILGQVISTINGPITFWLDGHCSLEDTAKGETMTPLLSELEQIKQHPIKTHTILIDDIRQTSTSAFDYTTLEQIIAKLKEINPDYSLTFEDGFVKNDILVAYIKNKQ